MGDGKPDATAGADYTSLLEERAEDLYENAPVGYVSSLPDGTLVKLNATFLRWTGYRRDDLVAHKRLQDLLAPGARIYYETHYAPLLQMQGSVREIAVEIVCADGRRLPALVNSTLVRDDAGEPRVVRTTIFDASDRRRYERELLRARTEAESRARAALALAHATDGVLLVGASGNVDVLNPAAEALLGVSAAASLGRPVREVVPEWESLESRIPIGGAGSEPASATLPLVRGGRELWLAVGGLDSGDGIVYTLRDVTVERRLERLRADLVTVVSHEFRTPLTAVYGAAQTLLARADDLDPATRRALLEQIVEEGARVTRILDQILLTSRLDAGDVAVADETFDAAALVERVVARVGGFSPQPRVEADVEAGTWAAGDADWVEQVLANVIDNALKYAHDGGPVRVAVAAAGSVARFTVSDEGPGVPATERTQIFEKFHRLDPNQRRGVGGVGLGLYIARELVGRMDGRIGLLPSEQGTTVFVDLPLAQKREGPSLSGA